MLWRDEPFPTCENVLETPLNATDVPANESENENASNDTTAKWGDEPKERKKNQAASLSNWLFLSVVISLHIFIT